MRLPFIERSRTGRPAMSERGALRAVGWETDPREGRRRPADHGALDRSEWEGGRE